MSDATRILAQIDAGDPQAASQLLPLVYDELRKLAAARLAHEKPGQTLQATALVHEAYLRLVGPAGSAGPELQNDVKSCEKSRPAGGTWNSRGHFFAAAAEAMRRILIERARQKQSLKGGGEFARIELSAAEPLTSGPNLDLIALDDALNRLAAKNSRQAELVKLRFFAGLTNAQAAEALGISATTADNDWAYARSWLRVELDGAATRPEKSN